MSELSLITESERWRHVPASACTSHAKRVTHAQQFDVRDPVRLLALAVISLCVDDLHRGASRRRKVTLDVEFWARMAEVPESWIDEILGNVREEAVAA